MYGPNDNIAQKGLRGWWPPPLLAVAWLGRERARLRRGLMIAAFVLSILELPITLPVCSFD